MARSMRVKHFWRSIRHRLPPVNFITLHYAYFIFTSLISAIIFWGSSTPARSVSFVDSLFLTVSAMTEAGLNTINLSTLNTFQQVILFILIMLGSAIWVSAWVVLIRRHTFEDKFKDVLEARQRRRSRSRSRSRSISISGPRSARFYRRPIAANEKDDPVSPPVLDTSPSEDTNTADARGLTITFQDDNRGTAARNSPATLYARNRSVQSQDSRRMPSLHKTQSQNDIDIDIGGFTSRNSGFHGLDAKAREKLGGYEYRAVSLLAWLVPAYHIFWQLLGAIGCGAWVAYNQPDSAYTNGLNPFWVGAFNAISAFNNSGMSLLDANMVAFQQSYYMLLTMSLLILAGNTCYPVFLRLIVWVMYKLASKMSGAQWEKRTLTLRFLLDHPRRCYTNLFPAEHTWWLLATIVCLNGIDWAAFEILNIGNSLLDDSLPTNIRVIDGLFQAFAIRSGGFYVVTIPDLRIALLVLYVVMMYIAVYPVVITMRSSNVYEERSLGIYADDPKLQEAMGNGNDISEEAVSRWRRAPTTVYKFFFGANHVQQTTAEGNTHFVRQQLRAQLSSDLWVITLALILVMIIENQSFVDDPINFSVFNFLFELVSGFGTVGVSVGVPNQAYSFCGSWTTLSKLILCFVMIRGRHRGLPVAIDKAVLLPGEASEAAEEDDGRIRMARSLDIARCQTV